MYSVLCNADNPDKQHLEQFVRPVEKEYALLEYEPQPRAVPLSMGG